MQFVAYAKRAVTGLFLLALCLPFLAVLRSPQLVPSIRSVVGAPAEWDHARDALRRTTPLWNRAVELYSQVLYKLGTTSNTSIGMVGTDGWVFLGDSFDHNVAQALGRRVYDPQEVARWSETLKEEQAWLNHRGIPLLFVVAPAKWSIYPDRLPAWAQKQVGTHSFDLLLRSPLHLPLIDLRPVLRNARATADTYSPLNSHWTDYGAWVAWKAIAKRLGSMETKLAGLYVPAADGATTVDYGSEFRDMISLPEKNRWTLPRLEKPLPSYEIVAPNGSTSMVPGLTDTGLLDLPRTTRNPSVKNNIRALVLRDSMGDSLSPYLQAAFRETTQVNHSLNAPNLAPNVPALVEDTKPDLVLYVMTERYLDRVPGGLELWKAANDFDLSASGQVGAWKPGGTADGKVRVEGSPSLNAPVSLYWPGGDNRPHVVRIDLNAKWSGQLQVQLYAKGKPYVLGEPYAVGNNQLYFNLPAYVDGSRVTLARGSGSAAVSLQGVTVRVVAKNDPTTSGFPGVTQK